MEHAGALDHAVGHVGMEIIGQRLPARQHRLLLERRLQQAERRSLRHLQRRHRALAQLRLSQGCGVGTQQRAQAAELGDQAPCQRLGIPPRNGEGEQIFDQLMIEQRLRPAGDQPLAQPRTVAAGIMRGIGIGHRPCLARGLRQVTGVASG